MTIIYVAENKLEEHEVELIRLALHKTLNWLKSPPTQPDNKTANETVMEETLRLMGFRNRLNERKIIQSVHKYLRLLDNDDLLHPGWWPTEITTSYVTYTDPITINSVTLPRQHAGIFYTIVSRCLLLKDFHLEAPAEQLEALALKFQPITDLYG